MVEGKMYGQIEGENIEIRDENCNVEIEKVSCPGNL